MTCPRVKIGKAAEFLGVSVQTLRKLEDSGELVSDRRSEGGVRYYDMGKNPRATGVHCVGRRSRRGRASRPSASSI